MTGTVVRLREAADWMRLESDPVWAATARFLVRVADTATQRTGHMPPGQRALYLATGERADAAAIADAYLGAIHTTERTA